MKKLGSRMKSALLAFALAGSFSFGAVAVQPTFVDGKCTSPETGCPCRAGCTYGGDRHSCCLIP
ncbi:hypothetical protein J5226_19755 [Lysobacter sp. K5869]|uniref:hypothetical protein n=1 Tax=Lysobacter sp. K5869 TaxID=2820808 RepID=UPI001C0606FC|nr:hypothetical protein [Lysobacter sp. K5869]QWP75821.1 hypothetical protein J5226_19755 [Lysobacter sp. K5869]